MVRPMCCRPAKRTSRNQILIGVFQVRIRTTYAPPWDGGADSRDPASQAQWVGWRRWRPSISNPPPADTGHRGSCLPMASGRLRLQHHPFVAQHLVHSLENLLGDAEHFQQMTEVEDLGFIRNPVLDHAVANGSCEAVTGRTAVAGGLKPSRRGARMRTVSVQARLPPDSRANCKPSRLKWEPWSWTRATFH